MKNILRNAAGVLALALSASIAWAGALDDALSAYKAGEWAKARDAAVKVKTSDGDYAKAQYVVGECRLMESDWSGAATAFEAVLAKKPAAVPALTGLGRALVGSGDLEKAKSPLEKAVKLDPKDAQARRSLGELYVAAGDLKKAKKELSAAFKLDPKDTITARALVGVQLDLESAKGAMSTAKKIGKTRPEHPMGHFLIGWVHDRENDAKDAIAAYEKAVALDDTFLDAHKNLAIVCTVNSSTYSNRARVKKAMKHYKRYFELGGKDAQLEQIYRQLHGFLSQSGFDIGDEAAK